MMAILEQEWVLKQKNNTAVLTWNKLWPGRASGYAGLMFPSLIGFKPSSVGSKGSTEAHLTLPQGCNAWDAAELMVCLFPLCRPTPRQAVSIHHCSSQGVYHRGWWRRAGEEDGWAGMAWISWPPHNGKEGWPLPAQRWMVARWGSPEGCKQACSTQQHQRLGASCWTQPLQMCLVMLRFRPEINKPVFK